MTNDKSLCSFTASHTEQNTYYWKTAKQSQLNVSAVLSHYELHTTVTSHAFTPSSGFGRGDVIISYGLIVNTGARLAVASERISHGFQFQFCQLPKFSQYSIRSSVFRIYPVSAKRSRAFQFRHLRSSDFDDGKLVQSNSFSRSISFGVLQSESIRSGYN